MGFNYPIDGERESDPAPLRPGLRGFTMVNLAGTNRTDYLLDVVERTILQGGTVIIPAFAVGPDTRSVVLLRTTELTAPTIKRSEFSR